MFVINQECRSGMAQHIAGNSIDAIVTDPPYGLSKEPNAEEVLRHWLNGDDYTHTGGGFMGKKWDSFVPGPSIWREVFRCLKPGGYALVFAGSRTQDLMSMALRLAGFEIRDTAMWLYGSGFPKSLDVAKAIDAADRIGASRERSLRFTAWMRSTGITGRQINDATGSNMGSHYLTDASQPAIATLDMFEKIKHMLPPPPPHIMELMEWRTVESENMKKRPVIGEHTRRSPGNNMRVGLGDKTEHDDMGTITTAHTEAAKQWEGWGTALKPAYEPIIIARKPLVGTVADNVLTHGTGAINIDGCRVEGDRWPANIMHDGLDEPWARYFYCPKANRKDRDAGLEGFDHATAGEVTGGRTEGSAGLDNPRAGAGRTSGGKNTHPTVKPTELMRYCCRLVTRPGGLILDPFAGSGSTGRGAVAEGFQFIGFEMDEEHTRIANARIMDVLTTAATTHNIDIDN